MDHPKAAAGIDAVVPVTAADLARFEILFRSLSLRYQARGTLWVVVPDQQLLQVRARLAAVCGPAIMCEPGEERHGDPGWVRLVGELEIVPELSLFPHLRGWYRQQLVKLAIADHVGTDFYVTLDADVVCTRVVRYADLVRDGRGVCRVYDLDLHPDWYRGSTDVLGLTPARTGISHNVTPALLSRQGVRALLAYLDGRAAHGGWSAGLRGLKQGLLRVGTRLAAAAGRPVEANWRTYLAAGTPWTEYGLYYTFLEATGRFETYHVETPVGLYERTQSIWRDRAATFDSWDPTPLFAGEGLPSFVVIQSITGLSPERIWRKLSPFLSSPGEQ